MKLKIFAVRDRAADMYANPIFLVQAGQAIRMFSDEINGKREKSDLNAHPEDYDLYELGEFDTVTGTIETTTPRMIAIGKDQLVSK